MRNSTLLKSLASLLWLAMAVSGARLCAQTPAGATLVGSHRPAGVPEDYVTTPNGYFHPSCVIEVKNTDTVVSVDAGRAIRHADGTLDNIAACNYPRYSFRGQAVTTGAAEPQVSGWVEYASITTSTSFGGIIGTWTVPPGPSSNNGQILFFFPGLEDDTDVVTILQPVMAWNECYSTNPSNCTDHFSGWSIASWNCCYDNVELYSSPMGVSTGDLIFGEVFSNCDAGLLSCPSWFVMAEDAGKGSTSLTSTSNYGQTFNWAFGGVLEVGDNPAPPVVQCGDYPSNGSLQFGGAVYDENFEPINNPAWVPDVTPGLTPQCNYSVQFPGGAVTLYY